VVPRLRVQARRHNDPDKWLANVRHVRHFRRITYEGVYPGIHAFITAPAAARIRYRRGAEYGTSPFTQQRETTPSRIMKSMTYTEPLLAVIVTVSFTGLVLLPGRRGRRLLWTGLIALFLVSWAPADWLFAQLLEWPYRGVQRPEGAAQAIVILSSHVEPSSSTMPFVMPDEMTFARCRYGAWLYRHWRPLLTFVSGAGSNKDGSYASAMAQLIQAEGVPKAEIMLEEKSRNTHENAAFTARLLREKGLHTIVLVVEADSMLRAEKCFQREGVTVIPAPFRHRTLGYDLAELLPSWQAVRRNERTLHELGGLAWYKLRGWI
jgi:uncharacterized SAM-binding protein YcdF (DUF218 family)